MNKQAQLSIGVSVKGEPMVYQCSLSDQVFALSEDETAKESMAKLWAEFKGHVRECHLEDVSGPDGR